MADERADVGDARIEWVPIDVPKPNPRNARVHSRRQQRKLAAIIKEIGFLNPILVDEGSAILAGHGRLAAAKLLELRRVPIIRFGHLTEAQKRAYVIADNKIAEQAGWDRELLAAELAELAVLLPPEGLDVSLTAFETAEIDVLQADMAESRTPPEDIHPPLPAAPVSRPGDLWQLGKHRLLCGDARDRPSYSRLMHGVAARAVFCDPPYNVRIKTVGGRGRFRHPEFAFASGEMSRPEYLRFLKATLGHGVKVSADGAMHFVCIDWRHIGELMEVFRKLYGAVLNIVVWNKTNAGQGSLYRAQHELIGVGRVGNARHQNNIELGRFGRNRSNVWTYQGVNTFAKGRMEALAAHPTVKPVALVADALLDCTARGDVVLDQFCGSGTTILAAEKVGRVGYGIEYEPRYVDVAIKRWQSFTKLEAILVGDGGTFEEVGFARLNSLGGGKAAMTDRKAPDARGYAVGSRATQFKPGKSGNPKGRPNGSRPIGAILRDILRQKVPVAEHGKARRIPVVEVALRRLTNDAMRGDRSALKLLFFLIERYAESPETALQLGELLAEDQEILAQYLPEQTQPAPDSSSASDSEGNKDGG